MTNSEFSRQTLMEMGFGEKEVEDALRLHNNNQSAACDWLLGDRSNRPSSTTDASAVPIQGLDLESSLYEAIMTNPIVQQGLNNTRCLHAFLSMLENPTTTTHYLNDTEVCFLEYLLELEHAYAPTTNVRQTAPSIALHPYT